MQSSLKNYSEKGNDKANKKIEGVCKETEELIAIVAKSIVTARKNNNQ